MARIYAEPADLPEAYREDSNAETLIRRASNLVTSAIANARFTTDSDGMPTGDALTAAHDAVVSQVSTWLSTGVNPVTGYAAKGKTVTSKGSNGSTIAYAVDMAREAYLNGLAEGRTLTDDALLILDAEGLLDPYLTGGYSRGRMYNPVPSPDVVIDGGDG